MNAFNFENEVEIIYNGKVYYAYVKGNKFRDEFDYSVWNTELDHYEIYDEQDNKITPDNSDEYYDLVEELNGYDFEGEEYEPECFDYDDEM